MASLHLHAIEEINDDPVISVAAKVVVVWFVMERSASEWTPDANVLHVFDTEEEAEHEAEKLKANFPHRHFGTAVLHSEAHHVAKPVVLVRAQPQAEARPS